MLNQFLFCRIYQCFKISQVWCKSLRRKIWCGIFQTYLIMKLFETSFPQDMSMENFATDYIFLNLHLVCILSLPYFRNRHHIWEAQQKKVWIRKKILNTKTFLFLNIDCQKIKKEKKKETTKFIESIEKWTILILLLCEYEIR